MKKAEEDVMEAERKKMAVIHEIDAIKLKKKELLEYFKSSDSNISEYFFELKFTFDNQI